MAWETPCKKGVITYILGPVDQGKEWYTGRPAFTRTPRRSPKLHHSPVKAVLGTDVHEGLWLTVAGECAHTCQQPEAKP